MAPFELLMLGDPAHSKRPSPETQDNAPATFDSSGFFQDFHVLARRRQALKRVWRGVPGIYLFRGSFDARAVNEEFRSHLCA